MRRAGVFGALLGLIASSAWAQPATQAPSGAPIATTTVLGLVKPDGTSITINGAGVISSTSVGGVTSFNTRTGAVTLSSADVIAALTYTPLASISGGTGLTCTTTSGAATCSVQQSAYSIIPATNPTGAWDFLLSTNGCTTGVNCTVPNTNDVAADVLAQEYSVAATGSAITVPAGKTWLNLTQSGTIATQTVNLPSSPSGGQQFYCSTKSQITQLTLSPTAQGWANGATLGAGQGFVLLYSSATSTWTRIS